MTKEKIKCKECGEILKGKNIVWLELSITDGEYYLNGIPKNHESQGFFPFGSSCYKKIIKGVN